MSRVDRLWRSMIISTFFKQGWGEPEHLRKIFAFRERIQNREYCFSLVSSDYPVKIEKDEVKNNVRIVEGSFLSPFSTVVPGVMPEEAKTAKFQALIPTKWNTVHRPMCLHLGGTGDHGFLRRRKWMAEPLLKDGIASVILENPYYGCRKPKNQRGSGLLKVTDLFVMGGAIILESLVVLHWCERQGLGPLGLTGISMGGFMASLAASAWDKPISLVPCLSWTTASSVFTKGVLSGSIPWKQLEQKFFDQQEYSEIGKSLVSPEEVWESPYAMGKDFVQHYPKSLEFMGKDIEGGHPYVIMKNFEKKNSKEKNVAQDTEFSDVEVLNGSNGSTASRIKGRLINSFSFGNLSPSNIVWPSWFTFNNKEVQERIEKEIETEEEAIQTPVVTQIVGGASSVQSKVKEMTVESLPEVSDKVDIASKVLCRDTLEFMIGILDECTHLGNYAVPVDPELIIIISADRDAYVPRGYSTGLDQIWRGAEVRTVDYGHIAAFFFKSGEFRKAIKDAFDKQIEKHYS